MIDLDQLLKDEYTSDVFNHKYYVERASDRMETHLAVLKRARDYYLENGGATFELETEDHKVCAVGALNKAQSGNAVVWHVDRTCHVLLDEAATELYRSTSIVDVNDVIGFDAVVHCYEIAIKHLSELVDGT